ncbi:MAG: cell division protein FtsQ/DivIB [Anaerolineae bacterium]
MTKREYRRTAALLGAQPRTVQSQRGQGQAAVRIPWRLLAGMLLLVGVILWLLLDPRWYVDGSHLQVAGALSLETAYQVGTAADVLGLHGAWLRSDKIITQVLQAVPSVTQAEVECWPYPAQCLIKVRECPPVLIWQAPGDTYWISAEGEIFPARAERPDLPVVRGPLPMSEPVPHAVLEGVSALLELGVAQDGLAYHAQRGLVWTDPEGREVALGTGDDMARRLRMYEVLVADFETRGVRPQQLDVSVPEAPTYSLERDW